MGSEYQETTEYRTWLWGLVDDRHQNIWWTTEYRVVGFRISGLIGFTRRVLLAFMD